MSPGTLSQNIGRGWPSAVSSIVRLAPPRRLARQAGPRRLPSPLPSQCAETCPSCFSFVQSCQMPSTVWRFATACALRHAAISESNLSIESMRQRPLRTRRRGFGSPPQATAICSSLMRHDHCRWRPRKAGRPQNYASAYTRSHAYYGEATYLFWVRVRTIRRVGCVTNRLLLPPLEHLPSAAFSNRRCPVAKKRGCGIAGTAIQLHWRKFDKATVRHLNFGMVRDG